MDKVFKYYHTVIRLNPIQVIFRMKYILKRRLYEKLGGHFFARFEKKFENQTILINADQKFLINDRKHYGPDDLELVLQNRITFLNHEIDFGNKIDWHKGELNTGTRLWKLNLNYHEFLFDISLSYKQSGDKRYLKYVEETILEWFEQNPLGTKNYGKDNWNSYAISLRIISWIKIYVLLQEDFSKDFKAFFIKLLWIQSAFLSKNLEIDILGNHLIKNWKALIWSKEFFASTYFDKEIKTVEKYVYHQFSDDGMHEENSPMYAGIVLEDLMEVFLFQPSNARLEEIIHKLFKNVSLLSSVNQYLFFNDSVNNNGVQVSQLEDIYHKIFINTIDFQKETVFNIDGYLGCKSKNEHFVFDCAQMVEGRQPGHVHCDALSFEYFFEGKKVFTNSGTFEYNAGDRRTYSRSCESHNALKYDKFEQSEVWGSFRMARSAKVKYKINSLSLDKLDVEGTVEGYDFSKKVTHKRHITKHNNKLRVKDVLYSKEKNPSALYFHLTPEFKFQNGSIIHGEMKKVIAQIKCSNGYRIEATEFYPEFGIVSKKETMIIDNIHPEEEITTEFLFDG